MANSSVAMMQGRSMNSIATGSTPALMMSATQAPATSLELKPISTGRAPSGLRRMRRVASVTTPSWPSDPQITPKQVKPARIQMRAADLDHGAVHRHHRHAQQVVGRHPVFQAMRPARIHRDIARDGAGKLRGRIGGVEEPLFFDSTGHRQVGAPRLHPDEPVVIIGFQHRVHPRHAQDHRIRRRQRPARKRGARARAAPPARLPRGRPAGRRPLRR